jgi:aspartyl-tRNA(Asn)/glutamyl-tRNA(Gln) amidotransferase subunit B
MQQTVGLSGKIGLEIHAYLTTKEKLFCPCLSVRERGTPANVHVCPICTGQPGAKPMRPNAEAVRKAVQISLLLGCTVNTTMPWIRKHYSWPDLPKGYQTTMSGAGAMPLGVNGVFDGIRIGSMHLEEDPAAWDPNNGAIDYNRSGLALVEIVTEPDFTTGEQVKVWVHKLIHALHYLKAIDTNAGIKADVNVSIPGKTERVEIKNVTSVDAMLHAVHYELDRQNREGSVRETRRYDEAKGTTIRMRSKEQAEDYRFIVDPDLVSTVIPESFVQEQRTLIPELPEVKLAKLVSKYAVGKTDAAVLAKYLDVAVFFEHVAERIDSAFALPWITIELLRVLNWNKKTLDEVTISVEHFVTLLRMVRDKKITELQAKQILNQFVPHSFDPSNVAGKINDERELEEIILRVIMEHATVAAQYRAGDAQALNFLLGAVMKVTERRADATVARKILVRLLG